jgi:transcriptional regulator with XRE-family HTH domain
MNSDRREARQAAKVAFGTALASAMQARGMTQVELAEQLGVTQSMVSEWRAGLSGPKRHVAFEIERILSLTPGTLSINAGYLPVEALLGGPVSVHDAVLTDGLLSEDDKLTVLVVYDHLVTADQGAR